MIGRTAEGQLRKPLKGPIYSITVVATQLEQL